MPYVPKNVIYGTRFRVKLATKKLDKRYRRLCSELKPASVDFKAYGSAHAKLWHRTDDRFPNVATNHDADGCAWILRDHDLGYRKPTSRVRIGPCEKSPSLQRVSSLRFGSHGLMALNAAKLRLKCVTTLSLDLSRALKKKSQWIPRLVCDNPVTARPTESRMGKGKGGLNYWESKVRPGAVMFEFCGTPPSKVHGLMLALKKKTPTNLKLLR